MFDVIMVQRLISAEYLNPYQHVLPLNNISLEIITVLIFEYY